MDITELYSDVLALRSQSEQEGIQTIKKWIKDFQRLETISENQKTIIITTLIDIALTESYNVACTIIPLLYCIRSRTNGYGHVSTLKRQLDESGKTQKLRFLQSIQHVRCVANITQLIDTARHERVFVRRQTIEQALRDISVFFFSAMTSFDPITKDAAYRISEALIELRDKTWSIYFSKISKYNIENLLLYLEKIPD